MKTRRLALAIAMMCASSATFAAQAQSDDWLPKAHQKDGVSWISGGVGKEEVNAMHAVASRYNLRLIMAEAQKPRDAFLGDVSVKITGPKGNVLDIRTDGPLLYVKLPPGRYTVSAEVAGHTLTRTLTVKAKASMQAALIWPEGTA